MRAIVLGEEAPGSLLGSYVRAFRALGADAQGYCMARWVERSVPLGSNRIARRAFRPALPRRFNHVARRALAHESADLVLVLKGQFLDPSTIEWMRTHFGCPVVNFYPDDPFLAAHGPVFGKRTLASYDACFTYGTHLLPEYARAGAKATHYLPFAADLTLHQPVTPADPPEFDVVFVGNIDCPNRLEALEAIAEYRVAVFGHRTSSELPRRSRLSSAAFYPPAYGDEFSKALSRGAISLNVMRDQARTSHNMRTFESPACGAFTLGDRTPDLNALFEEGKEMVCFSTTGELREQVETWLRQPAKRRAVAAAGLHRARRETYAKRAETILEALSIAPLAKAAG